jgi:integrase
MRVTEPYTIFPRKLSSGKIVYYFMFRDENGRRSAMRSTGATTLASARRYCQKLYNENQFKASPNKVLFKSFTKDFFKEDSDFCKWKVVNDGRPIGSETLRRYVGTLNYQLLPFFGDMLITSINTNTIKKWIIWATDKWSPKTINNAQGVLSLIFRQAIEKGIILNNPLVTIKFRKVQRKKRELLTVEEIRQLYNLKWINETQRKAFLLASVTGMRIGEVCALQKVDINTTFLDIKHSYSDRFGLGETKTRTCRCVPIPAGLDLLADSTNDSNWVFKGVSEDKPLLTHNVYNSFTRNCDKLNIDRKGRGITLHSLRNFFISYMQGKNVPIQKIKAVVGHSDPTMTDWYTYWSADMFEEVYKAQQELYNLITKQVSITKE